MTRRSQRASSAVPSALSEYYHYFVLSRGEVGIECPQPERAGVAVADLHILRRLRVHVRNHLVGRPPHESDEGDHVMVRAARWVHTQGGRCDALGSEKRRAHRHAQASRSRAQRGLLPRLSGHSRCFRPPESVDQVFYIRQELFYSQNHLGKPLRRFCCGWIPGYLCRHPWRGTRQQRTLVLTLPSSDARFRAVSVLFRRQRADRVFQVPWGGAQRASGGAAGISWSGPPCRCSRLPRSGAHTSSWKWTQTHRSLCFTGVVATKISVLVRLLAPGTCLPSLRRA